MDVARLAQATRSWWWVIVLFAVVGAGGAYVASQLVPREYTSTSAVLVGSSTDVVPVNIAGYQHLAQTYAQLATTSPVLARVASQLQLSTDLTTLSGQIDARVALDSTILTITARAGTAAGAAALADAVAAEVVRIATPANGVSLASVVQPATLPTSASSPRTIVNTGLGLAFGAIAGLALALLLLLRSEKRGSGAMRDREQVVSLLEERFGRRAS